MSPGKPVLMVLHFLPKFLLFLGTLRMGRTVQEEQNTGKQTVFEEKSLMPSVTDCEPARARTNLSPISVMIKLRLRVLSSAG